MLCRVLANFKKWLEKRVAMTFTLVVANVH